METLYLIARLRRLHDLLEKYGATVGSEAIDKPGAGESRLLAGRSLAYTHSAHLIADLIAEVVRDATRSR